MKKQPYAKPVIVAQNNKNGSFAAGCPESNSCQGGSAIDNRHGGAGGQCRKCERTK